MTEPMDVKDELLPCPFCGDDPEVAHETVPYDEWFLEHRCRGNMMIFLGPRDAPTQIVESWNSRLKC